MKKGREIRGRFFMRFGYAIERGLEIFDATTIIWYGSNPKLTRSKGNNVSSFVIEFDLGRFAGFLPSAFDHGAVLEDISGASANGLDDMVVIIRIEAFVNHHHGHSGRGELLGNAAILLW